MGLAEGEDETAQAKKNLLFLLPQKKEEWDQRTRDQSSRSVHLNERQWQERRESNRQRDSRKDARSHLPKATPDWHHLLLDLNSFAADHSLHPLLPAVVPRTVV